MIYLKYFEALTTDELRNFCEESLVWLLDDPTFSFSVKRDSFAMIDNLKKAIPQNKQAPSGKWKYNYIQDDKQAVVLKPNNRTHTILIERNKVTKLRTLYPWDPEEAVRPYAFSWDNVKDDVISLISRLERKRHILRNICLLDDKGNPKSFSKDLLEKTLPYKITKIYITITK